MGLKTKIKELFGKKTIPIYVKSDNGSLLKNRVALITGGGSGIGFEIAKSFINEGCEVIIAGRNEDRLKRAVNSLNKASYIILDICNIKDTSIKIKDLYCNKKIDILVNCAGLHYTEKFLNVSEEEFDKIFNTNIKGTYFISQIIANLMIENNIKGNILNISSTSGIRPAWGPYQMSKWAMNGMTLGFADKLLNYGIIVNSIAPGQTCTEMLKINKDNITNEGALCGRFILPEEVASVAVFLVSGSGRMIVGDNIYVSGGSGIIDSRR